MSSIDDSNSVSVEMDDYAANPEGNDDLLDDGASRNADGGMSGKDRSSEHLAPPGGPSCDDDDDEYKPPRSSVSSHRLSRTASFFGSRPVFKERDVGDAQESIETQEREDRERQEKETSRARALLTRLGIIGGKHYFPFFTIIVNIALVVMMIVETVVNGGIESFGTNPWAGPSLETLIDLGAKVTILIQDGQVWRLFSATFLHAGWLHLLGNLVVAIPLGILLERIYGFVRMATIYLVSGIGGNLLSAVFYPDAVTVGASGAVFGLIGVVFVDTIGNWKKIERPWLKMGGLIFTIVVSFGLGLLPGIDNFAHIGGWAVGMATGMLVLPDHLLIFGCKVIDEEEVTEEEERLSRAKLALRNGQVLMEREDLTNAQKTDVNLRMERIREAIPALEASARKSRKCTGSYVRRSRIMFGVALPFMVIYFTVLLVLLFTVVTSSWCVPCEVISCVGSWCDGYKVPDK
mmetsp:Transcript_7139/g.21880  ORF Transcript_7139/g.21880 Transcript_7139/m.21880 type:complete len:463 (+) Transcript_7139:199-1587(+)|eukprot:CAMPEP_0177653730 /NCGR_PEP_ID=MMETSP0447-20121125/13909_1 /TAXON_ID=0 /ORGANISM="Stygamoeba regulata, Strain BSH-02190019" /LENGTH=462 /DNA_ID=CAMNT_0019157241 /DNA_START=374 /DNA_END=1762 /DNA_ORIENTATION=+